MRRPTWGMEGDKIEMKSAEKMAHLELELEQLRNAIRQVSHDPRLLRLAGPGSYEIERAAAREEIMIDLFPRCEFGNSVPSPGVRGYREQYQRVVDIQAVYKWKYGKPVVHLNNGLEKFLDTASRGDLCEHIRATEKVLAERDRVLNMIPECPEHGPECTIHALEWVIQKRIGERWIRLSCGR